MQHQVDTRLSATEVTRDRQHLGDIFWSAASVTQSGKAPRGRAILAVVGILGPLYFASTILILSLLPTGYDPITQFASDYGVGSYAVEMNLGFLLGGVGLAAFALAAATAKKSRKSRAGSVLVFFAGMVLVIDGFLTTDVEGSPHTLHGFIHAFGGFLFFLTAPVGLLLLVSSGFGRRRRRVLLTLLAFVAAFGFLVANSALSLNAAGVSERMILLVVFASVIFGSLQLFRDLVPQNRRRGRFYCLSR